MATILEAASQLLGCSGEEALTTTAVAERAGVSIGTIYQYFPSREAILLATVHRDQTRFAEMVKQAIASKEPERNALLRPLIRTLIRMYAARGQAREQAGLVWQGRSSVEIDPFGFSAEVLAEHWLCTGAETSSQSARTRAFVMTRAVRGVLTAANLEAYGLIQDQQLEDLICDIIISLYPPVRAGT